METRRAVWTIGVMVSFVVLSMLGNGPVLAAEEPNDLNGTCYSSSGTTDSADPCPSWFTALDREGSDGGHITVKLDGCQVIEYTVYTMEQGAQTGQLAVLSINDVFIVWDEDLGHGSNLDFSFTGSYVADPNCDYVQVSRPAGDTYTNWVLYRVTAGGTLTVNSTGLNEHDAIHLQRNWLDLNKDDGIGGSGEPTCVSPGDEITYTICWDNTGVYRFEDCFLIDWLPEHVTYPGGSWQIIFDPNLTLIPPDPSYDPNTHSYAYLDLGTLAPDDANCVELTVVVDGTAEPGYILHNVADLYSGETLIARATVDTPVCCWDDTDPNIIYVDWAAEGDNVGTDWINAYNDLQDAITRATETTCAEAFTIYVAQGPYSPGEYAEDSFVLPEGTSVYGGFPNGGCAFSERNPKRYETILTGLIDATHRNDTVVTMGDETLLDGVTVSEASIDGYGIYGLGVDFIIENCTIQKNWAYGAYVEDGNATFRWCTIRNNDSDGIYHQGEGFELTVENCWIRQSGQFGIYSRNSTLFIKNSIVSESDLATEGRAGIRMFYPTNAPVLYNNTIAHNKAAGISFVSNGDPNDLILPDVQNCIVYYNNDGGPQLAGFTADQAASYSCIQDCNSVNYNINADPNLAYFDPNNVRITYASPCREAGNPSMSYDDQVDMDSRVRVLGTRVDIGAYEIDCEDTANLYDWNADGLVNLYEFNSFSRAWLAHDPNDPAWVADPNVADPNLSEGWYDGKYKCNLVTAGSSAYQVDLADLVLWLEESPWLWQACWRIDDLLSEQSAMGSGENLMLAGIKTMSLETEAVEEKSAIEQAVDLAEIIIQLEQLWKDEPDIQQEINAEDWNRFMESVYNSLSELEIGAARTK